ncbi:MAG: hypothetical protein LBG47_10605 [Prevotellaceae bacterium]|nr:hypothetical protein [Prevotellaceae bacterium]
MARASGGVWPVGVAAASRGCQPYGGPSSACGHGCTAAATAAAAACHARRREEAGA